MHLFIAISGSDKSEILRALEAVVRLAKQGKELNEDNALVYRPEDESGEFPYQIDYGYSQHEGTALLANFCNE